MKKLTQAIAEYDALMLEAAELEVKAHTDFGEALRSIRKEKNITLRELARRTGLSAAFISDVELGRRMLSGKSMRAVEAAL